MGRAWGNHADGVSQFMDHDIVLLIHGTVFDSCRAAAVGHPGV